MVLAKTAIVGVSLAVGGTILAVPAPTDYTGIAALAMAFSALLAAIGVMVVNIMNARTTRKAQEAKDERDAEDRKEIKAALKATAAAAADAAAKSEAAKTAMDGGLAQLIRKVEQGGESKGKADEKEAQAGRTQAASDATAVEQERARQLVKDAAVAPGVSGAAAAPGASPNITIEKVVTDNVDAQTVNTETLNTGKGKTT